MKVKMPSLKGKGPNLKGKGSSPKGKGKAFSLKRKGKGASDTPKVRKGPQIKAPKFVSDLFQDLKDKRLLLPVAALLVALIAVPMLLSSSGTETVVPPAPALADGGGDASAVESAVLVEQVGIRNYHKRLEALKQTNPSRNQCHEPRLQDTSPACSRVRFLLLSDSVHRRTLANCSRSARKSSAAPIKSRAASSRSGLQSRRVRPSRQRIDLGRRPLRRGLVPSSSCSSRSASSSVRWPVRRPSLIAWRMRAGPR